VHFSGDVRIGDEAAHGDLHQRFPDPHLPIGTDQHHAQRLTRLPLRLIEDALGDDRGAGAVLDVSGPRPARLHVGERGGFLAGIGKSEARQSALGRHD
jgi:hypothetical protein